METIKVIMPSKAFRKSALSYFDQTSQDLLLSYNPRTIAPRDGEIAQDVPGRATGSWLPLAWYGALPPYGVESSEQQCMSLSHDNVDPTKPALAIGSGLPLTNADGSVQIGTLTSGAYYFDVDTNPGNYWNRENWSFGDIGVGNEVYCYENLRPYPTGGATIPDLIILVQMRTQMVAGVAKTVLRVQARQRSDAPAVWDRNLNNPMTAEYFRD